MAKRKKRVSPKKKARLNTRNWRRCGIVLALVAILLVSISWHKGTARRLLSTGKTFQIRVQQTFKAAVQQVSFHSKPATLAPLRVQPGITTASLLKGISLPPGAPPATLPQGVVHFKDGIYAIKDGWIYRGDAVIGAMAAATRLVGDSKTIISLPFDYVDLHGHLVAGNLLRRNQPELEGTSLLVNDRWWAFATGQWVYVGKPVSGHTYPGFELNGGGRLTDSVAALFKLFRMDRHHHIRLAAARGLNPKSVSSQDIDTLQRVADAETGGQAGGVSTYDGQVVSFGLSQWTLGSGRLQDLISTNSSLFARYGIATDMASGWRTDPARFWNIGSSVVPRIAGVQSPTELTGPYWSAKFFQASLDPAIIGACIKLAVRELNGGWGPGRGLGYAMDALPWLRQSNRARGLLAELENNRPAYLTGVVLATANGTANNPLLSENDRLVILMQNMARPYEDEFARRSGDGARAAGERFAAKIMGDVLHEDVQSVEQILRSTPVPAPVPVPQSLPAPIVVQNSAPVVTVTRTVQVAPPPARRLATAISNSGVPSKMAPKPVPPSPPQTSRFAQPRIPAKASATIRPAAWNKESELPTTIGHSDVRGVH